MGWPWPHGNNLTTDDMTSPTLSFSRRHRLVSSNDGALASAVSINDNTNNKANPLAIAIVDGIGLTANVHQKL